MIVMTKKHAQGEFNLNAQQVIRDFYAHNAAEILIIQFMQEVQAVNAQDAHHSKHNWDSYLC